jgi:hypothetical protein
MGSVTPELPGPTGPPSYAEGLAAQSTTYCSKGLRLRGQLVGQPQALETRVPSTSKCRFNLSLSLSLFLPFCFWRVARPSLGTQRHLRHSLAQLNPGHKWTPVMPKDQLHRIREEEEDERSLIVDLKGHTQLAVAWSRDGSLVPRWT